MVSTRNATRTLLLPPSLDVEMEDVNTPLSPADTNPCEVVTLHSTGVVEHYPTHTVQPATHSEPTLQQVSTPHFDLAALLADIASTVHIENLQFSMSQNTVLHNAVDVAALQAYIQ